MRRPHRIERIQKSSNISSKHIQQRQRNNVQQRKQRAYLEVEMVTGQRRPTETRTAPHQHINRTSDDKN